MGKNPSQFKGDDHPVENVSWDDAQKFIRRLNQKEGTKKYRLPTEAEWEYAVRAGTNTVYSFVVYGSHIEQYAWYVNNSGQTTHPVGKKLPNPWGLYDMHGNVGEWVQDGFSRDYYAKSPGSDPQGPTSVERRVLRGGGWRGGEMDLRSANRKSFLPNDKSSAIGFRVARSLD